MILINLLPHREVARTRRLEAFQVSLFVFFLVGLIIAGVIYWWLQMLLAPQQGRNQFLSRELGVLEGQIKEIAIIEVDISAFFSRQKAVENLQADRNMPVQ